MVITDRWAPALLLDIKERGDAVVVYGLRGRELNRRIGAEIRDQAMEILRQPPA